MVAVEAQAVPQIPHELLERKQWVVWRLIERDGKLTKVPFSPYGMKPASSTDPRTWGTYVQCVNIARARHFDGIGFVFSADDPYVGIDLDGCFDMVTATLSDAAEEIMMSLGGYTEFSPSGRGLHIIVKATLPTKGRRSDAHGVEMYAHDRFFTMTGNVFPDMPTTIEDRQSIVTALYERFFPAKPDLPAASNRTPAPPSSLADRDLIDIATRAVNGARFYALWRGDTSAHGDNDSSADLALCNLLAFYTGDPARTDQLFRQSGLYRDKWDAKRGGTTYGAMTISEAFAGRTEFYAPRQSPVTVASSPTALPSGLPPRTDPDVLAEEEPLRYRFLSDEEQDHRPKPSFLIGGILIDRGINILFGDSQAGKTFLGLDLSLCVATDREWHDHHTEHGTVAYIAGEDPDGVILRKSVWKKHFGYQQLKKFFVLDENVPLMQDPHVDSLIRSLKSLPGDLRLIVIDTLSCAMVGNDSDKTKDAVQFMEVIKRLRTACNCAILLIHHKNKQGQELGNVSFRNGSDVMLDLERDGDMITLKSEKTKNAARFDPIYLTMAVVGDSCVLWPRAGEVDEYGRLSDTYANVLDTLKEHFPLGVAAMEWRKATDVAEATFWRALKALKAAGYVNMQPGGGTNAKEKYVVSPLGRAYHHDGHMDLTPKKDSLS